MMVISSAYLTTVALSEAAVKSRTYVQKISGPSTDPWGTPLSTAIGVEEIYCTFKCDNEHHYGLVNTEFQAAFRLRDNRI